MLAKTIPIEITTIAAPIMKPRRLQTLGIFPMFQIRCFGVSG